MRDEQPQDWAWQIELALIIICLYVFTWWAKLAQLKHNEGDIKRSVIAHVAEMLYYAAILLLDLMANVKTSEITSAVYTGLIPSLCLCLINRVQVEVCKDMTHEWVHPI